MVNLRYQTIEGIIEALKDLERKGIKLEDRVDLKEASNKILQENGVKETIDVLPKLIDKLEEIQGQQKETKAEVERGIEMKELEKAKALSKAELEALLRDLDESEKQAVEEAISNDPNTTKEQIEQFIKRQQEIKQEALRREEIETKIKQQVTESAEKLVKEENIVKRKEEIENLKIKAEKYIEGEYIETKSALESEFIGETKKIVLQNNKEITELKKGYLREKIENELIKPGVNLKEREAISKYADLVSKTLHPDSKRSIEMYKSEAVTSAEVKKINPGKVETGWNNLKVLNALMESPIPVKELTKQYDEVKIKDIPADLPQCRALDEAFASVKELPKLNQLVSLYQTFTGNSGSLWWKVAEKVGLDKVLINASEKILGASGGEFTKNALVIFANRSPNDASVIVMSNYLSGGQEAVAAAAAIITAEVAVKTTEAAVTVAAKVLEVAKNVVVEAGKNVTVEMTAAVTTATANHVAAIAAANTAKTTLVGLVEKAGTGVVTASFGTSLMAGIKTALGPVGWIVTAGMILLRPIFDKITEGFKSVFGNTLGGLMGFGAQVGASLWGMAKTSALFGKLGGVLGLGGAGAAATGAGVTAAGAGAAAGGAAAAGATVAVGAAVVAGGWVPLAVIGGIILIFVFGISMNSMASSLVPPEGAQDLEEEIGEETIIDESIVYDQYKGVIETYTSTTSVTMYVFEKNEDRRKDNRIGQRYDLGRIDSDLLKVVEKYNPKSKKMDLRVEPAFIAMVDAARKDGILEPQLVLSSGYRSYEQQRDLWNDALKEYGSEDKAKKYVGRPGFSPHHTGRTIDICVKRDDYGDSDCCWKSRCIDLAKKSTTYKWLSENAATYGFYFYQNESWHLEYNPKQQGL